MRIGINLSEIQNQAPQLQWIALTIVKLLTRSDDLDFVIFSSMSPADLYKNYELVTKSNIEVITQINNKGLLNKISLIHNYRLGKDMSAAKLDIYLSFGVNSAPGPQNSKSICITGDANIDSSSQRKYLQKHVASLNKFNKVILPSNYLRRELVKLGLSEKSSSVMYNGYEDIYSQASISTDVREVRRTLLIYNITQPYIFYNGPLSADMNVSSLLKALSAALKRFPDLKLVLSGSEFKVGWDGKFHALTDNAHSIERQISELKLKHNVVITGEIDNHHLPVVMASSKAFVHLGNYEASAQSVINAIYANTKVIAANRAAYPEILESLDDLVNPVDETEIAEAIIAKLGQTTQSKRNPDISFDWTLYIESLKKLIAELYMYIEPIHAIYVSNKTTTTAVTGQDSRRLFKQLTAPHKVSYFLSQPPTHPQNIKQLSFWGGVRLLFGGNYQLLVLDTDKLFAIYLAIIAKALRMQVAITCALVSSQPSRLSRLQNFIKRAFIVRFVADIALVSDEQHEHLMHSHFGVGRDSVFKQQISLPQSEHLHVAELMDTLQLNRKTLVGLHVANKIELNIALELPQKLSKTRSAKFIIITEDKSLYESANKEIADNKFKSTVTFLVESVNDASSILQCLQIFVCNTNNQDSSWLVAAMASGNAIVTSRGEAYENMLKSKLNCLYFEYGDERMLLNSINTLIDNKELSKAIQKNNAQQGSQYEPSRVIFNLLKLINHKLHS